MIIKLLLVVWVVFWLGNVVIHIYRLVHISKLLHKLEKLLIEGPLNTDTQRRHAASIGLSMYPEMRRIVGWGSPYMSHTEKTNETISAMANFYEQLADSLDFSRHAVVTSLNPIAALQNLFLVPSWIIEQFGLNLRPSAGKLFSFVAWLLALLAGIFSDDVRSFILKFFQ